MKTSNVTVRTEELSLSQSLFGNGDVPDLLKDLELVLDFSGG